VTCYGRGKSSIWTSVTFDTPDVLAMTERLSPWNGRISSHAPPGKHNHGCGPVGMPSASRAELTSLTRLRGNSVLVQQLTVNVSGWSILQIRPA
jgi:hypothetical protein